MVHVRDTMVDAIVVLLEDVCASVGFPIFSWRDIPHHPNVSLRQEASPRVACTPSEDVSSIGQSEAIRCLQADIECAARSDAKVLITGETGVGKEVVARLIHQRSARAAARSSRQLRRPARFAARVRAFGHVRGSFTGAYRDKPGLLEMAPNGTVFLDEVGEMSPRMQVVLLRFLETGEIQRIGADRSHTRVNVRLITATNRDLQAQIAAGAFREDLYFRLNVIRL